MVKKLTLSIITLCYLFTSTGFAYDVHFCMGEKVGVELFASENEACGKCGMREKETGCCHDEHKFFKLEIPGKQVSKSVTCNFSKKSTAIDSISHLQVNNLLSFAYFSYCLQPPLPDYTPPRLFILHCVHRL